MEQANLNKKFVLERLFIGFIEELTGLSTIDSYRAKSACARSILKELYQALTDWKDKKIKSPETVISIRDETLDLVESDSNLIYGKISKAFFQDSLKELRIDGKELNMDAVYKIEYNLYYLIVLNREYQKSLIDDIEIVLSKQYYEEIEFNKAQIDLNKYCAALVSELLNSGYSKVFLRSFMKSEFAGSKSNNFKQKWENFKATFSNEEEKDYVVIFKIFVNVDKVLEADFGQMKESMNVLKENFKLNENAHFNKFLLAASFEHFVPLEARALDRYQAAVNARKRLSIIIDIIHLIYPQSTQSLNGYAIVIEKNNPSAAYLSRQIVASDGPKPNPETYASLVFKLTEIRKNESVLGEVSDKLYACVKHLRLANESDDLEQKFLNCWIGLENIFANYHTGSSTFGRIKEHLVNAHQVSYVKRNIHNFHKTICVSTISKQLSLFNKDDISYLTDERTYTEIISLEQYYPSIAYRAGYLKSMLFNGKRREAYIAKHKLNLERQLVRMYRIRNEIVHDAKSSYKLDIMYSNLRYYLTFILSKCVEFFSDCKPKPISNHKVSLDDFFHYQYSILHSMKKNQFKLEECVLVPHSVELFI